MLLVAVSVVSVFSLFFRCPAAPCVLVPHSVTSRIIVCEKFKDRIDFENPQIREVVALIFQLESAATDHGPIANNPSYASIDIVELQGFILEAVLKDTTSMARLLYTTWDDAFQSGGLPPQVCILSVIYLSLQIYFLFNS